MSQKLLFLISLSLFAGVLFSPFLRAKEFLQTDGHNEIIVRPSNDQQSTGPRMPSSIRIEAYYDADFASVCAYLVNAGETVDVEFNNLTTGDSFTFEIPGSGMSVMPIGGATGYWTITFTLSSGSVYFGEFEI